MKNGLIKHLPNLITGLRIICALVLLTLKPFSFSFFTVYIISGASDLLDGFLARQLNVSSYFGATLDSIADLLFYAIAFYIFFPYIDFQIWLIICLISIVIVRLLSLIVGYWKFKDFAFLHTSANKLAGFSVFCFPFLLKLATPLFASLFVIIAALLSAIEELIINIISKRIQKNITTIFALKKEDR